MFTREAAVVGPVPAAQVWRCQRVTRTPLTKKNEISFTINFQRALGFLWNCVYWLTWCGSTKLWFYFFDKKREKTQKVVLNWLATSEITLEHAIRSGPSLRLSISVKEASIFLDRSSRALCLARGHGAKPVHCAGILETAKNTLEQSFFAVTFAFRTKSREPAHAYCGMLAARCGGRVPIVSRARVTGPQREKPRTSSRQSVLVSPPEYSTTQHHKMWLASGTWIKVWFSRKRWNIEILRKNCHWTGANIPPQYYFLAFRWLPGRSLSFASLCCWLIPSQTSE